MQMNNIPRDWKVDKLGNLGSFSKGAGITKNDLVANGVPCVRYAELYTVYNFVISQCVSFISEDVSKISRQIERGDILFAGSGETKEEIGKCAVYDGKVPAYAGGDNIIFKSNKINPFFLSYFFNTVGRKYLNRLGQGDSIVHIHAENLKQIFIPIPQIAEQEKMVKILKFWDWAISKLSELIVEKRKLKLGLMQQLLTCAKRLPGFDAPWKEIKCSDVLFERKTYLSKGKELEHVSLTKEGIVPKTARYERDFLVKDEEKEYKITKLNDICYNPANLKFGVICRNTYGDGIFSPIYVTFEVKNMNTILLGFIVKTHMFQGKALRYEQGTVYERMAVGVDDFLRIKLTIPSDIEEQKAIADVLSKADSEIDLLNQQLDVLKEQKRGLMQKLLTGEIRVKTEDATC